jgi:uncharacterized protein YaaW (UPF0174 family)
MSDYRTDHDLTSQLANGSKEDIAVLVDLITDNGKGRLSLSQEALDELVAMKVSTLGKTPEGQLRFATELQKYGANTLISFFRGGKGVLYKEIVCDVADHVGANHDSNQDVAEIESAILLKIVERSLEKMSESEKKEFFNQFGVAYTGIGPAAMVSLIAVVRLSGLSFYRLATIVAQATAKSLIGRGLTFATTGTLMRGISVFSGPIGWAITGIWTAFDLASPAYRVTVPCVIQLAYMRQKLLIQECPSCHAGVTRGKKFCGDCGHKFE